MNNLSISKFGNYQITVMITPRLLQGCSKIAVGELGNCINLVVINYFVFLRRF